MQQQWRALGRIAASAATLNLVVGCAQLGVSTRAARIGPDDPTDVCRPQVVALDSTGNFFAEDILTGAAVGAAGGALAGGLIGGDLKGALIGAAAGGALGAASGYWAALQQQSQDQAVLAGRVQSDLARENAQIDRVQAAFDADMDCRFGQARAINADFRAQRIDGAAAQAAMERVKVLAVRDLNLARSIDTHISGRAGQFEVAADNVAPRSASGATQTAAAVPHTAATVRRATSLKLRPDPAAPDIASVTATQPVTVGTARNGYAAVQTADGQRGYAPVADLKGAAPVTLAATGTGSDTGQDVQHLVGSNAARRDAFSDSVAISEQAAAGGFEVAG